MASLAGKADSTVVNVAYAAGMAGVPKDYSKQFETMAAANETIMTSVKDAWTTYETARDAEETAFQADMQAMQAHSQTIANPKDFDLFVNGTDGVGGADGTDGMWDLADELKENNGYKNDPQKYLDWKYRANRLIERQKNDNQYLATTVDNYNSPDADISGMDLDVLKFARGAIKYFKNPDQQSGKHNKDATTFMQKNKGDTTDKDINALWKHLISKGVKDGTIVKYYDPVSNENTYITKNDGVVKAVKASELPDIIPMKRTAGRAELLTGMNNTGKQAQKSTNDYSIDQSNTNQSELEEFFKGELQASPDAYNYYSKIKVGPMTQTLEQALNTGQATVTPNIIASLGLLETINNKPTGFKDDGDLILEEEDFLTKENYTAMVNYILSGDDPSLLNQHLAVHYNETGYKKMWNGNKKVINKPGVTTNSFVATSGVTYTFPYKASDYKKQAEQLLVTNAINKEPTINILAGPHAGLKFELVDKNGKTDSKGLFYKELPTGDVNDGNQGYGYYMKKEDGKEVQGDAIPHPEPMPIDEFIRDYGGVMQPTASGVAAIDYTPSKKEETEEEKKEETEEETEEGEAPKGPYRIQIGVHKGNIPADLLAKMTELGDVSRESVGGGGLWRYFYGAEIEDHTTAEELMEKAKGLGFKDTFIWDTKREK